MKTIGIEKLKLNLTVFRHLNRPYSKDLLSQEVPELVVNLDLPTYTKQKPSPQSDVSVKKLPQTDSAPDVFQSKELNSNFRVNDLNIQMLSRSLYKQIFGNVEVTKDPKQKESALRELKQHNLPGSLQKMPDIDFQLPRIFNGDIEQHFYELGNQQSAPYRNLADQLIQPIPKIPKKWIFAPGWTKYVCGEEPISVPYPQEEALVFDVEVCCKDGENPVLATAVSNTSWYCWVSNDLYHQSKKMRQNQFYNYTTDELVNLETPFTMRGARSVSKNWISKPKLVVGHHVSYDRARIKEQYLLERTGLRFLDTMSLHIANCGVTSQQKANLKSGAAEHESWVNLASLNNSLSEVYKFYCNDTLQKEQRDVFVEGDLKDIKNDFSNLVTYCARDVEATHMIFTHLWPTFLKRFPHPVTIAGILELTTAYLPVNRNWRRYIEDSDQTFDDLNCESKFLLSQQANKCCQLLHDKKYQDNLWLWDEDWTQKTIKLKKSKTMTKKEQQKTIDVAVKQEQDHFSLENDYNSEDFDCGKLNMLNQHFKELLKSESRLPKRLPYLAGIPQWYRNLCNPPNSNEWKPGPETISTSMKCSPKLLSLTWNFMPLHRVRKYGWCYVVPWKTEIDVPEDEIQLFPIRTFLQHYLNLVENGVVKKDDICDRIREYLAASISPSIENLSEFNIHCGLIKLPHKNGADQNVGNPLSRDFINKFSDAEISCNNKITQRVIQINRQLSYWKNNRDRIVNQIVVWLRRNELPYNLQNYHLGVILPQVIPCGTLTRRAVESTWMTASNADQEKIGSELRSMVQSPPGYNFIGADVDSQELWIASLIGDSYFVKEHGCTAFSWMTLSGQKSDGTDMHSVTAKTMGITRNNAKIINYARIYGAGLSFSGRLLQQFVPGIAKSDAAKKAQKMFELTKGKRIYRLKDGVSPQEWKRDFTRSEAKQLCSIHSKSIDQLFDKPKWTGGSESAMFNSLEEIACKENPTTPFLNSSLSQAVCPAFENDNTLLPTRINWVVQSSAVDFLHLMLVCMRWLIDPKIRFCLSFHDEVRYLVPDSHKYPTTLALHVTNLLVRSFFVKRLGMTDLPQSVAFFSAVEVDTVFRKDASLDGVTPSNPHGLCKGYGIPLGESLDVYSALEKAKGKIGIHSVKKKSGAFSDNNVN